MCRHCGCMPALSFYTHLARSTWEAEMRNIKWFATAAATALILTSAVVWSTSNTEAFVVAPSQIDPFQLTVSAKDLPTLTFEDRTFVF